MVSLLAIAPIIYWSEKGPAWLYLVGSSASWALPGQSGGARPRARSSAKWKPTSPAPPTPTRPSKPPASATENQARLQAGADTVGSGSHATQSKLKTPPGPLPFGGSERRFSRSVQLARGVKAFDDDGPKSNESQQVGSLDPDQPRFQRRKPLGSPSAKGKECPGIDNFNGRAAIADVTSQHHDREDDPDRSFEEIEEMIRNLEPVRVCRSRRSTKS